MCMLDNQLRMRAKKYILLMYMFFVCICTSAQTSKPTLYFISNSHLDTQWNWDVKTTINEYIRKTMRQNFALLDKYPYFNFNNEGAIKYMWMKEYYPSDYARLKRYVAAGRWHVSGSSVDANDVMTPSAESVIRNFLYGHTFFVKEFGVSGGHDVMLPDCFGFPYSLPSLASHCGLKGFHTAKLAWGSSAYSSLPPFGIWQGVDGSQIYAIYKPQPYDAHEQYNKDLVNDASMLSIIQDNGNRYGFPAEIRYVGPRSDRGGGLQDNPSSNGENTPYWLNYNASANGKVQVKMSTPDEIFAKMAQHRNPKYHLWNDELPMLRHGVGAYTSMTMLKRMNRKNELLADAAEKASALAMWLGVQAYPGDILSDSWIRTLWQQHHDGITGTSIPNAYIYSVNDYVLANKSFGQVLTDAVGATARQLNTEVQGTPMVVYNPLSYRRQDVVEGTMQVSGQPHGIRIFDPTGTEVLSQVTGYDAATGKMSFIFAATVPALGYAVYDVRLGELSKLTSGLSANADTNEMDNGRYRVRLNAKGDISQVYDLVNKRWLITNAQQQMLPDKSTTWPSWEIQYDDVVSTQITPVDENAEVKLVEDGPLRKTFRVSRNKNGSTFFQYVRLTALSDRIDCVNEVDWQTRKTMLKANFAFMFGNEKATYDLSLGTIQRGNRHAGLYEVQGHQWADVTNPRGAFGVSILNDCKYGWDKPNNNSIRLTLIHTPEVDRNYTYQGEQDLGVNLFTYSILPHEGSWGAQTQKEASKLNQPLLGFVTNKHPGELGKELEFIHASTDQVSIKALKKAERSDEIVVRVYEWTGKDANDVKLTFPADIVSAREVNGVEEEVGPATASGKDLTFSLGKYQPKTFAIRLATSALKMQDDHVHTTAVALDYNADLMSPDSKRSDASAGIIYAYPAEQVSDQVVCNGVFFEMGSRLNGQNNALRCEGQTVNLHRTQDQKKVYVLLASTHLNGSVGHFKLGDASYALDIPYYGGYVGQVESSFSPETIYRNENVALTTTHCHQVPKGENEAYRFLYIYKYVMNLGDGVDEITLPNNPNLYVMAMSVSDNKNDDVEPFSEINSFIDYHELGDAKEDGCGKLLKADVVNYSHQIHEGESAQMAADMDVLTKWCVTASRTPWLEYRFDEPKEICKWMVLNAGSENVNWISKAFKLQRYDNGRWMDVDIVNNNTENKVVRGVKSFTAQRVRLQMIQGEQENYTTRIYEFAVYGKNDKTTAISAVVNRTSKLLKLYGNYPNPCPQATTIQYALPLGASHVVLEIHTMGGQLVDKRSLTAHSSSSLQKYYWVGTLPPNIYLYRLTATVNGKKIESETKKLVIS